LNQTEKLFEQIGSQPFSLKRFFRNNIRGILATLMVHMFIVIVFLLIKIQGFKRTSQLDINIDYSQVSPIQTKKADYQLSPGEQAYLEKILSQAGNISNLASNTSEKLDKELSTENFVEEYRKQLEDTRSEEWKKQQEEINMRLQQPDYVAPEFDKKKEIEMDNYTGPSNVTYEFLSAPFNRYKTYLPVPVYKCQGEGIVFVNIEVDPEGKVVSAQCNMTKDYVDKECLLEVARNYALNTRFEVKTNAPEKHKAKIIYNFIPQ
jgi:hypothetical protein